MTYRILNIITLLLFLFIKSTFAVEIKKVQKTLPEFFGFPGAVTKLTDPSIKYYSLQSNNNSKLSSNNLEYFSVLDQDNITDNNLIYINNLFSRNAYLSYNEEITLQPIVNPRELFSPIANVYLEIQNYGYRTIESNQANIRLEQQRRALLTKDNGINIDFNDIVKAFNNWFTKNEVLIRTNTKYYLKIPNNDIEDIILTIVLKKNNKDNTQEYFIVSKNCKVNQINVTNNKNKTITITNHPITKIINKVTEKFNFDCAQFGIGGATSAIKLFVETFIAPRLLEEKLREKLNMNISRGGILYGPPGTGKTLFISTIKDIMEKNNLKVKVIKISGPEIFSRYVGDSEEAVRKIFMQARNIAEDEISILLIDEIDAMLAKRGTTANSSSGIDRVVNQFLSCLDGIDQKHEENINLIVFGTTNRLDLIDAAVTRPGRMDVKIAFNLPNDAQRQEIFEIQANRLSASGFLNADVNFQDLVSKTSGYTGAEIAAIVQKAQIIAIRNAQGITAEDNYFCPNKVCNLESLDVNKVCFNFAISQIQPQFGKKNFMDTTDRSLDYYQDTNMVNNLKATIESFKTDASSSLLIHITGMPKSGKSTLAALIVEFFGSSCYYLQAKDCAPYSRAGKKDVVIEALTAGEVATDTNDFSVILDDFDDMIEYAPAMAYDAPLVSTVKAYAKSSIRKKKGKFLIIIISTDDRNFLAHIFEKENIFYIFKNTTYTNKGHNYEEAEYDDFD